LAAEISLRSVITGGGINFDSTFTGGGGGGMGDSTDLLFTLSFSLPSIFIGDSHLATYFSNTFKIISFATGTRIYSCTTIASPPDSSTAASTSTIGSFVDPKLPLLDELLGDFKDPPSSSPFDALFSILNGESSLP
jgi:hypothetical protein